MRFLLLMPGKLRRGPCRTLHEDYAARCRQFGSSLELALVREAGEKPGRDRKRGLQQEADAMLARVPPGWATVALDEGGAQLSSEAFAKALRKWRDRGVAGVAFLVGSARGLHPQARDGAERVLSLSAMTLPHELAVALLSEQLYRGLSILANHPYHRS